MSKTIITTAPLPTTEPISLDESMRLIELEKVVKAGKTTFFDVGNALAEIRDKRLYKADFTSFDEYCVEKWGFKRAHARRLIEAAGIASEMAPVGFIPSERAARAIATVPKPMRANVVKAALAKAHNAGRSLTSADVGEAACAISATTDTAEAVADSSFSAKNLESLYSQASALRRCEFLHFVFTSTYAVETENKVAFTKCLENWLETCVAEPQPTSAAKN